VFALEYKTNLTVPHDQCGNPDVVDIDCCVVPLPSYFFGVRGVNGADIIITKSP
jgi:hypothetical protein